MSQKCPGRRSLDRNRPAKEFAPRGKHLLAPVLLLGLGFWGCAAVPLDKGRPDPRPLGRELEAVRTPGGEPGEPVRPDRAEEPSGPLGLPRALALALARNPELASISWEVRAGEARALQAGILPNPEMDLVVENFGNSWLEGTDATATTVQLSQQIPLGGKRSKKARVAFLERDLAGWDYESKRLEVFTEVSKAFVDVLSAQERLALHAELVRLAGQVHATVSERVKAGRVSPVEEIRSRTSLAAARIESERARSELTAARLRLAAFWGSASPAFGQAVGRLEEIRPIPPAERLADLVSRNPDLARRDAEMERSRAAVKLENARRIPDASVSGGVRRFHDADETAFLAGLSIPLPLFDRNQGGTEEARCNLARAGEERTAAEVRLRSALAEAYQNLSTAFLEATALRDDVLPGARSAFEAAGEGYRQGKFGYLDVLDAQRALFEARAGYIDALTDYHRAAAEVERLIGERLAGVEQSVAGEYKGDE